MMRRLLSLISLLALLPAPVASLAAGTDPAADAEAVRRVQSALGALSSLRARFHQTVTDAHGRLVESADGSMTLARPGRFRWDYRTPEQLIVSDGVSVWFYDAGLEQVTIRAAAETLAGTPATLLAADGNLQDSFDISAGGSQDGLDWSLLTPRRGDGDFQTLRLGFSGRDLRRMVLLDRLGQTTTFDFEQIERNPPLDASLFTFTPPAGVDVVGRAPRG